MLQGFRVWGVLRSSSLSLFGATSVPKKPGHEVRGSHVSFCAVQNGNHVSWLPTLGMGQHMTLPRKHRNHRCFGKLSIRNCKLKVVTCEGATTSSGNGIQRLNELLCHKRKEALKEFGNAWA